MVTNTRAQSQRSGNEAESSNSRTMSGENQPEIVDTADPGHISDLGEPVESSDDDVANVDERLAQAIRRRDVLLKKQELANIEEEISALEQGRTNTNRGESDDDTSSPGADPRDLTLTPVPGSKRPSRAPSTRATKRTRETIYPHSNLRPKDLAPYYGNFRREHREWTRDALDTFEVTPWNFQSESEKILWAAQFLKGDPKEQWHNEKDRLGSKALEDWDFFSDFLLGKIEDPINRQLDINQQYTDAKQRSNQSIHQFDAYLTSLEAQLPPINEEQRTANLMTRIHPDLKLAIISAGSVPTNRNEVLSLATRLEHAKRRRKPNSSNESRQRGSSNNNSGRRGRGGKPTRGRNDNEAGSSRNHNSSDTKGKSSKDKDKDKDWKKKNIECYNCHKMGHYATECKSEKKDHPNSVPVGSVGNIGVHAVEPSGKGKPSSKTP